MKDYLSLAELVELVDEPQRSICLKILDDHGDRFVQAPGSSHNHQAWTGGYADHITETMNLCIALYSLLESTGRLAYLPSGERFTLSEALVVMFVHDLEKPWRHVVSGGEPERGPDGTYRLDPALRHKADRTAFVARMLGLYGLTLSPVQSNALTYVEGIRDRDYTPGGRVILPLGALVHACDLWSARLFYGFPLAASDPWTGARRAAT